MNPALSPGDQQILASLQQAVTAELERKRRLGHYVAIWQDGQPLLLGPDAPQPPIRLEQAGSGRLTGH